MSKLIMSEGVYQLNSYGWLEDLGCGALTLNARTQTLMSEDEVTRLHESFPDHEIRPKAKAHH